MSINFEVQYNECYKKRLDIMKKLIMNNNKVEQYELPLRKINCITNHECIVIGTLFLESDTKYSILKNTEKSNNNQKNYFTKDAILTIEDDTGKINVIFQGIQKIKAYVSGMVVGFVGKINEKKIFECSDIIFPAKLDKPNGIRKGRVLLVSNLLLTNNNIWRIKVLLENCTNKYDEVIFIGDIFGMNEINYDRLFEESIKKLSLVPGFGDNTTQLLPQEPFPNMYFKKENLKKLNLLSNPSTKMILNNTFVILTHHIINDIAKYINLNKTNIFNDFKNTIDISSNIIDLITDNDRITVLEQIIKMRYLVPNAPDTIGCIPYSTNDPFVLDKCDVLVTGGCQNPIKREFENRILIGVPDFNKTGKAVILDLETHNIEEIEVL